MLHLSEITNDAIDAINQALDTNELNNIRVAYLGKKGHLTLQTSTLSKLPAEKRAEVGAMINKTKKQIHRALSARRAELENTAMDKCLSQEAIDVSLPGRRIESGSLHPVTQSIDVIENFFFNFGFTIAIGPEIEDGYHNFDALNIPIYHPARTDQDTFWFDATRLLRTQTSGVQIHTLKEKTPPIRMIAPGRVYRNDYDQTHTPMFHQIEGLIIDKSISFANLKWMLHGFLKSFFANDLKTRFRTSYFPFTEPSAEVDVMNQNGKWLEVIGCGMVHPNILRNAGLNSEVYSGFAFGMGIERLTMLRYGINDLRAFFENDLRFLKQFE